MKCISPYSWKRGTRAQFCNNSCHWFHETIDRTPITIALFLSEMQFSCAPFNNKSYTKMEFDANKFPFAVAHDSRVLK